MDFPKLIVYLSSSEVIFQQIKTVNALEADDVELRNTDHSMIVFGVDKKDENKILRELYTEFFQKATLLA